MQNTQIRCFSGVLLFLSITLPATAQTTPLGGNSMYVGGDINFTYQDPVTTYRIAPAIGYFWEDTGTLGAAVSLSGVAQDDLTLLTWGLGVSGRLHTNITDTLLVFGDLSLDMTIASDSTLPSDSEQDSSSGNSDTDAIVIGFSGGLSAGFIWFPAPQYGLEIHLGGVRINVDDASTQLSASLNILTLGMRYYPSRKP